MPIDRLDDGGKIWDFPDAFLRQTNVDADEIGYWNSKLDSEQFGPLKSRGALPQPVTGRPYRGDR